MITGRVIIDIPRLSDNHDDPCAESRQDRRRLMILDQCPDGAEVIVRIGARQYVNHEAAASLHAHDQRLIITIEGSDPEGVQRFVRAARVGEWSVVA